LRTAETMPFVIDELLAGAALDKALDGVVAARRFVTSKPPKRLLALLAKDFGPDAAMYPGDFYALLEDDRIRALIEELLDGRRQPDTQTVRLLAASISSHLHNVSSDARLPVATAIALGATKAYPLALREWPEFGQLIANKLDAQHSQTGQRLDEVQDSLDVLTRAIAGEQADVARALLAGPLDHSGQTAKANQARELGDGGHPSEAASLLFEIAQALVNQGLDTVAETYRLQAADLLAANNEVEAAVDAIDEVLCAQVDRGSPDAWSVVRHLESVIGGHWLVRAWDACVRWPEIPYASEWLRQAIDEDDRQERRLRWSAALVQIDMLTEDSTVALADAMPDGSGSAHGNALNIELDRIDALEAVHGEGTADEAWSALEQLVHTRGDDSSQGTFWHRKGYALARRGDLDGARHAYRRAMSTWARVPHHDEQVADALLSMQAAETLLGEWHIDSALRPIAFSMLSSSSCPVGVARRLQSAAASARIAGEFPDAHRDYWLALAAYRRAGSLLGVLHVSSQLAELYEVTGRPAAAVQLYIAAGKEKKAVTVASSIRGSSASSVLSPGGPRWQRIAAYNVLSSVGTAADKDVVAEMADQLLQDAAPDPPSLLAAQPASAAKTALASVALQLEDRLRDAAIEQARHDLHNDMLYEAARAAAVLLTRSTQLGIFDARDDLTECFLSEHAIGYVDAQWLADVLKERVELWQRMIDAAHAGSQTALEVLLWAASRGDSPCDLVDMATTLTEQFVNANTLEKAVVGDHVEVRRNMGIRFELGGLAACHSDEASRTRFVEHMVAFAVNDDEAEMNRASAVGGLFNVARAMTRTQRTDAWDALAPAARGEYRPAEGDEDHVDPLSRFQMRFNVAGHLHAGALDLLGRLWELGVDSAIDDLRTSVTHGLGHPESRVRAAAVRVLGRVDDLYDGDELLRMLPREDDDVRLEIVRALGNRRYALMESTLDELARDPNLRLRWVVLELAKQAQDRDLLEHLTLSDPDAYVRGLASLALARLETATNASQSGT
jgi:tetratricopeptide (TPR) repeat protein